MSFLKALTSTIDPQVLSFTKILQNKRGLQIGPDGTGQGLLYRVGLTAAGNTLSPEFTLARALKELQTLRQWDLDSQLSVVESRVFGSKYVHPNGIKTVAEWLAWRLPLAFPKHHFGIAFGWDADFYEWATVRARDHFVG